MTAAEEDLISGLLAEASELMDKAVDHTKSEFGSIRTGRAAPALVEKLKVDYYGSDVPLQQLAGFSVPEARLLVVQPYDKGSLGAIEKAIQESDLGITPSNDGNVIRLAFPELTAERRKNLVKVVRQMAEDGRISVRNARRSCRQDLEELEREGEISADDLERAEKELEKITHRTTDAIDEVLQHKEQELLEV